MHKKIKNGSFMNWIWFIIATLPFVLILIYAIGFFNNEDLIQNEQDNYTLTLDSINGATLKEEKNYINEYQTTIRNIIKEENGIYKATQAGATIEYQIPQNEIENKFFYYFTTTQENYNQFEIKLGIQYHYSDNMVSSSGTNFINISNEELFNKENIIQFNLNETNNQIKQILLNEHPTTQFYNFVIYIFNNGYNNQKEQNFIPIIANKELYLNYNWLTNYIQYINDFNTINYNSTPISYTYNNQTYNIETNSNNYLGENETININQDFNYTLNQEPTINYNNYFISNAISTTTTIYVNDLTTPITIQQLEQQNMNTFTSDNFINNATGYVDFGDGELWNFYDMFHEELTQENYSTYKDFIKYVSKEKTTYNYEYYNIESTINTSLELIPNINFNNFINNINNTIKTNGFISNAFLNLANLFNVQNVYYSLACYYIEYLLIIILLHLAFDVLYIVPNICHKFMEKIGGERD